MRNLDVSYRRWRKLRVEVLERDGYLCQLCFDPRVPADSADHIVPLVAGGPSVLENLRAAHRGCNTGRGAGGRTHTRDWKNGRPAGQHPKGLGLKGAGTRNWKG